MTFQIGDTIKCVDAEKINWYKDGDVHVTRGLPFDHRGELVVHVEDHRDNSIFVGVDQFKLVATPTKVVDVPSGSKVEVVCIDDDFAAVWPDSVNLIGQTGIVTYISKYSDAVDVKFEVGSGIKSAHGLDYDGKDWNLPTRFLQLATEEVPFILDEDDQVLIDQTYIDDGSLVITAPSDYDKFLDDLQGINTQAIVDASKFELGVARPVLETRKIGKVQIELVDTGFPNALWELAKLMSWASEYKGYKPNDWKNLPNAGVAFPAAASRHRMKPIMGEIHDPESGLFHKVHELFNVAAELELMLTHPERLNG